MEGKVKYTKKIARMSDEPKLNIYKWEGKDERWKNIYKVKTKDGKVKEFTTLEAVDDCVLILLRVVWCSLRNDIRNVDNCWWWFDILHVL